MPPLEIPQNDYNALISVISAPPEMREIISALSPCSKILDTALVVTMDTSNKPLKLWPKQNDK